MSLSFLGKKSFHPSAPQNVAKLFAAEEKLKAEAKKTEELKRMHEQEATRRETKNLLKSGSADDNVPLSMSFMYQLPPGMAEAQAKRKADAMAQQTKAEADVEKYGELVANAPRTGGHTTDLAVTHRPFGVTLKGAKCKRCGEYGHSMGDRECPMYNTVSGLDDARKAADDPMAGRTAAGAEASGEALRWKAKRQPDAGLIGLHASASDSNQQFVAAMDDEEMEAAAEAAVREQMLAQVRGEEAAALAELDPTVLSMLDERQKRKLLKMYRKELAGDGEGEGEGRKRKKRKEEKSRHKGKKEKREKHKKHKHKERRRRDSSGSASDSSGSD